MELDFEKLYNTYYMKIYSYIMTIVKNRELAEEITQEVFLKLLKPKKALKESRENLHGFAQSPGMRL